MKAIVALGSSVILLVACAPTGRGAQSPKRGEISGCFGMEQSARRVTLCLGPPRLPPGRYALDDSRTVPDATFVRHCEGRYSSAGASVNLSPERCSGFTVDEQLGNAGPNAPQAAPLVRVTLRAPASLGISIGQEPELELRRTE